MEIKIDKFSEREPSNNFSKNLIGLIEMNLFEKQRSYFDYQHSTRHAREFLVNECILSVSIPRENPSFCHDIVCDIANYIHRKARRKPFISFGSKSNGLSADRLPFENFDNKNPFEIIPSGLIICGFSVNEYRFLLDAMERNIRENGFYDLRIVTLVVDPAWI